MATPKASPQQRRVLAAETKHGYRTIERAYRPGAPIRESTLDHIRLVAERLGFPLPPEREAQANAAR